MTNDEQSRRLVLITGGGSGIGRATALRFAQRGGLVLVTDIDEAAAKETIELVNAVGGRGAWYRQDVTDATGWQELSDEIAGTHGVPDVLVNNAGIAITGSFMEQSIADWDRLMAVNLDGVFYGSRIVGEAMVQRGSGHIVNIASAGAWVPNRVAASYVVSKAAVLMLSESMRIDLSRNGIGVSAICPGVIRTNLMAHGSRAGVSDEEAARFQTQLADAQQRFSYAAPRVAARAVERAVNRNLAVVPVNPEAYFIAAARRVSPGLTRYVLSLGGIELGESLLSTVDKARSALAGAGRRK
ncbi:SDR family NAD(P)-dependent oxidoreductase [Nocardia altamirensis]|uniref:SDR family NAD(P)-dependent oxidoreductase n=1 Tax=Nocardia altamirensis TaxID=472158 RepID=UPI00084005E7|nr:SDR family NAD(P)-dependent oxidoreductase [Nocardia altamirensis]